MKIKYPRTYHLPYSQGATSDDKIIPSLDIFDNKDVVVTLKMDGENTTLYSNGTHARSLDSRHHPSRDWLKAWHSTIAPNIPEKYRVCGEYLYAKHSIEYTDLESYFYGFSVWNDSTCLSWVDTLEWFDLLDIKPVPVIYQGKFDSAKIQSEFYQYKDKHEGYVIRNSNSFEYDKFSTNVAKFVRANHVQTDQHWMQSAIIKNKLKNG